MADDALRSDTATDAFDQKCMCPSWRIAEKAAVMPVA
jgi:hypothetical protein